MASSQVHEVLNSDLPKERKHLSKFIQANATCGHFLNYTNWVLLCARHYVRPQSRNNNSLHSLSSLPSIGANCQVQGTKYNDRIDVPEAFSRVPEPSWTVRGRGGRGTGKRNTLQGAWILFSTHPTKKSYFPYLGISSAAPALSPVGHSRQKWKRLCLQQAVQVTAWLRSGIGTSEEWKWQHSWMIMDP